MDLIDEYPFIAEGERICSDVMDAVCRDIVVIGREIEDPAATGVLKEQRGLPRSPWPQKQHMPWQFHHLPDGRTQRV